MIGTLIPQTRELLQHVRKLSQLAGADDASARARSRRARRSLKVPPSSCGLCLLLSIVLSSAHFACAAGCCRQACCQSYAG